MGVLHSGKSSEAVSGVTCDRCGKTIDRREAAYHVWLWVVARVNRELPESSDVPWGEAVASITEKSASLSEDQQTSEVYARRSFLVCSGCKGHILADSFLGAK